MVRGYHKLPDKTAELWEGGWLHTGDLGSVDAEGYVRITGRCKDLLITASGKNIAPAEIEQHLLRIPGIGQAVAVGDRKPYLCALLVLDPEGLSALAEAAGVSATDAKSLASNPKVRAFLESQIESTCNQHLAGYQQVKYFDVLPEPFTVETDELTPTMKLKRHVVHEKYAALIEGLYERSAKQPA